MSIYKRFTRSLVASVILWSATAFAVQPLEMTDVVVVQTTETIEFTITGHNFMNGGYVELWLGGIPLVRLTQTDSVIIARLPDGMTTVMDGSYQMVATTGGGAVREDEFDGVTIGAQGLQGVPGIDGMDGDPGADGATGPQGESGPDGPAGADGATGGDGAPGADGGDGADGPPGADGAPGMPGMTGQDGDDGQQGSQGAQGMTGPAGQDGRDLTMELCLLYELTGQTSPESLSCSAGGGAQEGEFCGGFGGLQCAAGLFCELDPQGGSDPGGICRIDETNPSGTLRIQPIALCRDDGSECATIDIDQVGTIAFWQPTGITVEFLPALTLNDSSILDLKLTSIGQPCNDMLIALGGLSDPAPLKFYVADCEGGIAGASFNGANGVVAQDAFDQILSVVNHLIGHNLGLSHVDDPLNFMFANPTFGGVITDGQANIARGSALIE